jgi:hypothetical protein
MPHFIFVWHILKHMNPLAKSRRLETDQSTATHARIADAEARMRMHHFLLMARSDVLKPLLATLVRGADSAVLDAVRAQAITSGDWGRPRSTWQCPPQFRRIRSFLDCRTQWKEIELVCRDWRCMCLERGGGCLVVRAPRSTTPARLVLLMQHHRGITDLDLSNCAQLTDLSHLAALRSLEHLVLQGCYNAPEGWMAALSGLSSLCTLDLIYCGGVTDADMSHLVGLPNLRSLKLGEEEVDNYDEGCMLKGEGIHCLAGLLLLVTLDISGCVGLTDQGLCQAMALSYLQDLSLPLSPANIAPTTESPLANMSNLCRLEINDKILCSSLAASPTKLSQLVQLSTTYGRDSVLGNLPDIPNLRLLKLSASTSLPADSLPSMEMFFGIETLHLFGASTVNLATVARMPCLLSLWLNECDLVIPAKCPGFRVLQTMSVTSSSVVQGNLRQLVVHLPSLRHLKLTGNMDDEMPLCAEMRMLETVHFSEWNASYVNLCTLRGIPTLHTLTLESSYQLDESGVHYIAGRLTALRTLTLRNCRNVTETALASFARTKIQYLNLIDCLRVTEDVRSRLRTLMPGVDIT